MDMEWTYSGHAVDRMLGRGISTLEVQAVLAKPDGKIKQSKDKSIYFKRISGRRDNMIAVVAVLSETVGEILTVMNYFEVNER